MDFKLSEDQKMLKDTIRKISLNEFAPRAAEIDEQERYPWENRKILAEQGIFRMNCPEEFGGAGRMQLSLAIVIEEVARVCASTAHIAMMPSTIIDTFVFMGSRDQKLKWLKPIAEGAVMPGIAVTEPDAGSDVTSIKTTAVEKNGRYLIDGRKRFISAGGISDFLVVAAYTDKAKERKGISLFLVTKDTPGFIVGKKEKKLGLRGSETYDVSFEECFIPEENRLGMAGEGFGALMKILGHSRPIIGAQAVGLAQGALDATVDYSKTRIQFGKTLSQFQGLQWMMAEMALKVELARTMVYRACSTIDNEPSSGDIPRLCSMAKWFASDAAMEVTTDAVELFGGYGCIKEYPVERMMRDAKVIQIYEGTSEIQRGIIAKQLLR
jgi:alkylation response protein AidB-like acyl-CoA dehydrogenase